MSQNFFHPILGEQHLENYVNVCEACLGHQFRSDKHLHAPWNSGKIFWHISVGNQRVPALRNQGRIGLGFAHVWQFCDWIHKSMHCANCCSQRTFWVNVCFGYRKWCIVSGRLRFLADDVLYSVRECKLSALLVPWTLQCWLAAVVNHDCKQVDHKL